MTLRFLIFLGLSASAGATMGATPPSVMEIDPGITYVRLHSIESDGAALEKTSAAGTALILDARYTSAKDSDGEVLARDLAAHHGDAPVFVLVSPATPAVLAAALAKNSHVTTLGVADSVPVARIVVAQATDDDRRAYDAAESGQDLPKLISGKIEKERYDEASLVTDFNNGNSNPELPAAPDPRQAKDAAKPSPLVDRVLQRAVHLYRALAAIKSRS